MSWAKAERHEFMERLLGVAPTRRVAPVLQVEGFPDVAEIAETLDGLEEGLDIEEGVEEDEDVEEEVEVIRAPAERCRGFRSQSSRIEIAGVIETNYAVPDIKVHDAAIALVADLEGLGCPCGETDERA